MTTLLRHPARYPSIFAWLVFAAALDVMFTHLVLYHGGIEMNGLAASIMHRWGFHGMTFFKFAMILFTVCLCEITGRRDDLWGRRLGVIGVALTFVPVILASLMLLGRTHHYF